MPNNRLKILYNLKYKMYKVVKGAKYQERPSASYFYNELKVSVGFTVQYRPRKGGKMILHSLQLRKNGTPYWRAEEKLPTLKRSKRRNTRKRSSRRSTRRRRGTHKRSSRRSTRRRSARRSPRRTRQRRTRGKGRMHHDVVRFGESAEEGWIWAPPPQPEPESKVPSWAPPKPKPKKKVPSWAPPKPKKKVPKPKSQNKVPSWAPPPQPGLLPYTSTLIPIDKNNSLQSTGIIK